MIEEARLAGERSSFGWGEDRDKRRRPNASRRRDYRVAIWKRQGGKCLDCGRAVRMHHDTGAGSVADDVMTVRRVTPERDGGLYSLPNLVGLCMPCVLVRNDSVMKAPT
jgi:5-methylcytosine-specific restriction endonuclease McrA